jgi:hypothetical protein
MDTTNRLSRLGGSIRDAQESLDAAIREAEAILVEGVDPRDESSDWPALGELVSALEDIKTRLATLPGEDMAKAITVGIDHRSESN